MDGPSSLGRSNINHCFASSSLSLGASSSSTIGSGSLFAAAFRNTINIIVIQQPSCAGITSQRHTQHIYHTQNVPLLHQIECFLYVYVYIPRYPFIFIYIYPALSLSIPMKLYLILNLLTLHSAHSMMYLRRKTFN